MASRPPPKGCCSTTVSSPSDSYSIVMSDPVSMHRHRRCGMLTRHAQHIAQPYQREGDGTMPCHHVTGSPPPLPCRFAMLRHRACSVLCITMPRQQTIGQRASFPRHEADAAWQPAAHYQGMLLLRPISPWLLPGELPSSASLRACDVQPDSTVQIRWARFTVVPRETRPTECEIRSVLRRALGFG